MQPFPARDTTTVDVAPWGLTSVPAREDRSRALSRDASAIQPEQPVTLSEVRARFARPDLGSLRNQSIEPTAALPVEIAFPANRTGTADLQVGREVGRRREAKG